MVVVWLTRKMGCVVGMRSDGSWRGLAVRTLIGWLYCDTSHRNAMKNHRNEITAPQTHRNEIWNTRDVHSYTSFPACASPISISSRFCSCSRHAGSKRGHSSTFAMASVELKLSVVGAIRLSSWGFP